MYEQHSSSKSGRSRSAHKHGHHSSHSAQVHHQPHETHSLPKSARSHGGGGGPDGSYLSPGSMHRAKSGYVESVDSLSPSSSMSGHTSNPGDLLKSPGHSPSKSYEQSPGHSRSSSLSSVRSSLRDRADATRSLERGMTGGYHKPDTTTELTVHQHLSLINNVRHGSLGRNRDRSLDRSLARQREADRYLAYAQAEIENRDYPHMGAKSLERSFGTNLVRSRSIDYELMENQAAFLPQSLDFHSSETLILDMQAKIAELNKKCTLLQQDLEHTKDKLASSMNSIKTFWSPELKKERSIRKEECAKTFKMVDQMKLIQADNKKKEHMIHNLETQGLHNGSDLGLNMAIREQLDNVSQERDKQTKEILLLKKTVSEMELRIDTQKTTMSAQEESIQKLLGVVQSRDSAAAKGHDDTQREFVALREKMGDLDRKNKELNGLLDQKEAMVQQVRQSLNSTNDQRCKEYEDVIKSKNVQVEALQVKLQNLQEELQTKKEQHLALQTESKQLSAKFDSITNSSKTLTAKCEDMGLELSARVREVQQLEATLQTVQRQTETSDQSSRSTLDKLRAREDELVKAEMKCEVMGKELTDRVAEVKSLETSLDMYKKTSADTDQNTKVLREQLTTKNSDIAKLQMTKEHLEKSLKETTTKLTAAQSQLEELQRTHRAAETELGQLRDTVQSHRVTINRLTDETSHKEAELKQELTNQERTSQQLGATVTTLQKQLDTLQADLQKQRASTESARQEDSERCRQLQTELNRYKTESGKTAAKADHLSKDVDKVSKERDQSRKELAAAQNKLDTYQKEAGKLLGECERFQKESRQASAKADHLGKQLQQERERSSKESKEVGAKSQQVQAHLDKTKAKAEELKRECKQVTSERDQYMKETTRAQAETDRLLKILEQSEIEKSDMDKNIKDMQEQLKLYKRGQATKSDGSDESSLKSLVGEQTDRIEELEEALRESVKITAQRELVMARQQEQLDIAGKQMEYLTEEIELLKDAGVSHSKEISELESQIEARNKQLRLLQGDRGKQMFELYEMKQEALSTAITEKDAHIALLEIAPNKKTENIVAVEQLTKEKILLQQQLKDLSEKRLKLLNSGNIG